jgi:transcriptional regulator with XRE-family HTH domain
MNIEEAVETIQMNIRMYPAADVAEKAGISVGTVYRWRKVLPRRPSLEVFVRLACFSSLNIHIRELRRLV